MSERASERDERDRGRGREGEGEGGSEGASERERVCERAAVRRRASAGGPVAARGRLAEPSVYFVTLRLRGRSRLPPGA